MTNTLAKEIAKEIEGVWSCTPEDSDARIGIVNVANVLSLIVEEETRGWVSSDEFLDLCYGRVTA
jgi:hypothetical protein